MICSKKEGDCVDVNEIIKGLRTDNDLTQETVAQFLNVAQSTYSCYESGEYEISLNAAIKLAEYYHVSLEYVAGFSSYRKTPERLDKPILGRITADRLLAEVESLDENQRADLVRYLRMLKLEKLANKKKRKT